MIARRRARGVRYRVRPKQSILSLCVFKPIIAGFMANREESQAISQEILPFKEESRIHIGKSGRAVARRKPTTLWSHFLTDRKSTRLNSSHDQISYAVFCLK